MFTGLVEELGAVRNIQRSGRSLQLAIHAPRVSQGLALGDSVAVNGVCLTAVATGQDSFTADVMPETFSRTTLQLLRSGDPVNLERSLQMGSRLGGHLVQGHVDGVGRVSQLTEVEIARLVTITAPPELLRYIVPKGSIAVDGVSLTVVQVTDTGFQVSLIPHTAAVTTLGRRRVGDPVNLETDIIGKYVERLLAAWRPGAPGAGNPEGSGEPGGLSPELLRRSGFLG